MLRSAVALLLLTSLCGCSLLGGLPSPTVIDAGVLNQLPRIEPSKRDTCETRKMIARQESYIQTVQKQREVLVTANCSDQGAPSEKVASR